MVISGVCHTIIFNMTRFESFMNFMMKMFAYGFLNMGKKTGLFFIKEYSYDRFYY